MLSSTINNKDNNSIQSFESISKKMVDDPSYTDVVLYRELLRSDTSQITDALLNSAYYFTNRYHLLIMGISLRYSANPNMYIRVDEKSPVHIIYYLGNKWLELSDEGRSNKLLLFRAAIALLVMAGSDIHKLSIDEYAGRDIAMAKSYKNRKRAVSVYNAMIENMESLIKFQIETIYNDKRSEYIISNEIDEANNLKSNGVPWIIGPKMLEFIGIVLNRPGLLVEEKLDPVNTPFIFITDANLFINRMYTTFDIGKYDNNLSKSITDSSSINTSIEYISADTFQCLLFNGHYTSYIGLNNLIFLRIRYNDEPLLYKAIDKMIISAIKYGTYMDTYQLELLKTVSDTTEVENIYKRPFWQKFLFNYQTYTYHGLGSKDSEKSRLWDILLPLSIDPKLNIVDIGSKLYNEYIVIGADNLISALRLATKKRLVKDINLRLENRNIKIDNLADLGTDDFDYGYLDTSLYYDKINDTYWLFTRDRYHELVKRNISIYTNEALDSHFISVLQQKISIFNYINGKILLMTPPTTLKDAVNDLYNDIDYINNDKSNTTYSCFKKILRNNVLDMNKIDAILQKIGILSSVKPLKYEHQLYTVAWVVRQFLKIGGNINKIKEYVR